jgi:hypothetical protein
MFSFARISDYSVFVDNTGNLALILYVVSLILYDIPFSEVHKMRS